MNKKSNKKHKIKKNKTQKISELEMNKCNNFCNIAYLEKSRNRIRKTYKTNPYLLKLRRTDAEIEKLIKNINKDEIVNECKKTFCNTNCKGYTGKYKKMRYICPACKKKNHEAQKLGAITFCKYDTIFE
jgi:hypothetical protein